MSFRVLNKTFSFLSFYYPIIRFYSSFYPKKNPGIIFRCRAIMNGIKPGRLARLFMSDKKQILIVVVGFGNESQSVSAAT
jgi:hypothetical protein